MRITVVFALLGTIGAEGYPANELFTPSISVLVFDYAGVSGEILDAGLSSAKRILKSGGVEVVWVHCPVAPELLAAVRLCRDAPGPLSLVLHILPPGATRRQTEPGAVGWAVPPAAGGFGAFAGVFYDRVQRLEMRVSGGFGLGHVIAHELGHLLLGTGQHSAGGVMQGNWRGKQMVLATQGFLQFGPGERVRILRNMQLRTLASNLSLSQRADRQRD